MEASDLGRRLDQEFGDRIEWTSRSAGRLYVTLAPDALYPIFDWLRTHVPGLRLGTSTGIDLRAGVGVFHHFPVNGTALVVTLKVLAPKPDPRIPSLAAKIPSARWIEREMAEMLAIEFTGHPDPRPLLKAAAFSDTYPLRREFDPREFKESIGERLDF